MRLVWISQEVSCDGLSWSYRLYSSPLYGGPGTIEISDDFWEEYQCVMVEYMQMQKRLSRLAHPLGEPFDDAIV